MAKHVQISDYVPTKKGLAVAREIYDQMVKIERARCVAIVQAEIMEAIDESEPVSSWTRLSKAKALIIAGEPVKA